MRTGMTKYECAACGNNFLGLDLFDKHQSVNYNRVPAVRCKLPQKLGMVQAPNGTWATPEGVQAIARASAMGNSRRKDNSK